MNVRPMLFSGPMVRALLSGIKTQTRRLVKPQPIRSISNPPRFSDTKIGDIFIGPDMLEPSTQVFIECTGLGSYRCMGSKPFIEAHCRYGQLGDLIWVKETTTRSGGYVQYLADHKTSRHLWPADWNSDPRVSIHMNRWASRLTLSVKAVRVERLNDISPEDAEAEGLLVVNEDDANLYYSGIAPNKASWHEHPEWWHLDDPITAYKDLWESINGEGSWAANPWVWVVEFEVHKLNVDEVLRLQELSTGYV